MVGCGPAGAAAARVAAKAGLKVMIIDRRRSVGQPPRCAGFVPSWLPERAGSDAGATLQAIRGIRFYDEKGRMDERRFDARVIDRARFDKSLAISAIEAGADLCNATVLSRRKGRLVARRGGAEAPFLGQVVIGADGPTSLVARSLGAGSVRFLSTLQYEVGLRFPEAFVEVRQDGIEGRGQSWFVPSGRTARAGVALPRSETRYLKAFLRNLLARLEAEGRIHPGAVLAATGGLWPVGEAGRPATDGIAVLAGDAAGQRLPFAGCGVAGAYLSGESAGAAAADCVASSCPDALYDHTADLTRRGAEGALSGPDAFQASWEALERWARQMTPRSA